MKKSLTIAELTDEVLALARAKGFGATPEEINVAEKIALIHSEASEAYEAYRHKNLDDKKDGFAAELGDVIIRVLQLAGALGIDIEKSIAEKMRINESREWSREKLNENLVLKGENHGKN